MARARGAGSRRTAQGAGLAAARGLRPAPAGRGAFTLIELLIVVAILALLVSILTPAAWHVRALARRASCSIQLSGHGKALAMYVSDNRSYPYFANPGLDIYGGPGDEYTGYWPKFYGVLQAHGMRGTHQTSRGVWAYLQEPAEIWPAALCPAMDALAIWRRNRELYFGGFWHAGKPERHKYAVGYQWNFCLRAQTPGAVWNHCGHGRWNVRLEPFAVHLWTGVYWQMDPILFPPCRGGYDPTELYTGYVAQAVRPDEITNTARVAEAWDSCDIQTTPNVRMEWPYWYMENLLVGGHSGPYNRGTRGWALLNAARHAGSPNILYADGHVAADATRALAPEDLGPCPSGSWEGMNVTSWPDYDDDFGTLHHIAPRLEFLGP